MGTALNRLGMINNFPHRSSTFTETNTDIKLSAVQYQLWSYDWGVKQMVDVKKNQRNNPIPIVTMKAQCTFDCLNYIPAVQYSNSCTSTFHSQTPPEALSHFVDTAASFKYLKVMALINLLCTVICTQSPKFFPQPASVNGEKHNFTKRRWERQQISLFVPIWAKIGRLAIRATVGRVLTKEKVHLLRFPV